MYTEKTEITPDGTVLSIDFGKNGQGLSDELITISERIKEISETNRVYLIDTFVDQADDVYQFKFIYFPKD
jgi:hypothetical protein